MQEKRLRKKCLGLFIHKTLMSSCRGYERNVKHLAEDVFDVTCNHA